MQDLVRRLRSAFDPCTIYLFGSRAQGFGGPDSDFDVMVVVPETAESHFERQIRGRRVLKGFGTAVDLLVYTHDEWESQSKQRYSLARQVRDTGTRLHAA